MALSAAISVLKGKARRLRRERGIPLNVALDLVANQEGFSSWSLLASSAQWNATRSGELLLLGSRRGHGKTRRAMALAISAMRRGHRSWFFSLENDPPDLAALFQAAGARPGDFIERFEFDNSPEVCADYIIEKTRASVTPGSVIVVDYLQLLDQRRSSPTLQTQVEALRAFVRRSGSVMAMIGQIDRSFDGRAGTLPGLQHVRLPNPLDLALFDRAVFTHRG